MLLTLAIAAATLYVWFVARKERHLAPQESALRPAAWRMRNTAPALSAAAANDEDSATTTVGRKLTIVAWLLVLVLSSVAHIAEGRNPATTLAVAPHFLLHSAALLTHQSARVHAMAGRCTLLHQTAWFALYFADPGGMVLRRTIMMRVLGVMVFLDSAHEMLLHMLAFSMALYYASSSSSSLLLQQPDQLALVLLPLKLFFFAVLPLHALGLMDWLRSGSISASLQPNGGGFSPQLAKRFMRTLAFASCIAPTWLVGTLFVGQLASGGSPRVGAFALLVACAVLRLTRAGRALDAWLSPSTVLFRDTLARRVELEVNRELGLSALSVAPRRGGGAAFVASHAVAGLALWWNTSAAAAATIAALVVYSFVFVAKLNDSRPFSQLAGDVLLTTAAAMAFSSSSSAKLSEEFRSRVLYAAAMSTCGSLLVVCAKEVLFRYLAKEQEAEQFLAHAIKQRFAALGGAIEHVLQQQSSRSSSKEALLRLALVECRMGHDRCHACNVFRKLDHGERRGDEKREWGDVYDHLRRTTMSAQLLVEGGAVVPPAERQVVVQLDWELLHLVLTEVAKLGHQLSRVDVMEEEGGSGGVRIEFHRPVRTRSRMLMRLVQELGGTLEGNVLAISAPTSVASPPPSSSDLLPQGRRRLTFAIVDDNALVRSNFRRVLVQHMGVREEDVVGEFGVDRAECARFPRFICDRRVDVAVFDQNLDFGEEEEDGLPMLKGEALAREARQLGFAGCTVLHTSDSNIVHILSVANTSNDDDDCEVGVVFHGAVEKTADSRKFARELEAVIEQAGGVGDVS